jgi:hypothetical protein
MSELHWIVVPNGFDRVTGQIRLRVLIVPHLSTDNLADASLATWPPRELLQATLSVEVAREDGGVVRTVLAQPDWSKLKPDLWQALFGHGIKVTPARRVTPSSPSTDTVDETTLQKAEFLQDAFALTANNVTSSGAGPGFFAEVQQQIRRWSELWREPANPARTSSGSLPRSPSRPVFNTPDFHRCVALLQQHPPVLQAAGLIFELKLEPNALIPTSTEDTSAARLMRIRWPSAPGRLPEIVSPWTRFDPVMRPAATPEISAGMLNLGSDRNSAWGFVTLDVDNAAARMWNALDAVRQAAASANSTPPGMPAFRSAGVALVHKQRTASFNARLAAGRRHSEHVSLSDATFDADDLVLGYRIDVRQLGIPSAASAEPTEWLSLHQRIARYTVRRDGQTIDFPDRGEESWEVGEEGIEEGQIKPHAAVDLDGKLYATDVITRWEGYSLSVRRPDIGPAARDAPPPPTGTMPYDLSWKFSVLPNSLPSLRFGRAYQLRVRIADRAGGGLTLKEPSSDLSASEPIVYSRYDPVGPPIVRRVIQRPQPQPPAPDTRKTFDATVVLRSDTEIAAEGFSRYPDYAGDNIRELHPPRAPFAISEQHGAIDGMPPLRTLEYVRRAVSNSSATVVTDFASSGVCACEVSAPHGPTIFLYGWQGDWPDIMPMRVEAVDALSNTRTWSLDNYVLKVALPKGDELTLELSSLIRDPSHFAISGIVLSSETATAVLTGRHPMLSPATELHFVHAVRQPLNPPGSIASINRNERDTGVALIPIAPMFGLHIPSTGQLEVEAKWTDPAAQVPLEEIPFRTVQNINIPRGATELPSPLYHEIGDTKHRLVTYRLTAVSRFREFFTDSSSAVASFTNQTVLDPIRLVSTARPPGVGVARVEPAFSWTNSESLEDGVISLVRRREARIRLEIDGTWYQTGEEEKLGVIIPYNNDPPDDLVPILTEVATDPIWGTGAAPRWPGPSDFATTSGEVRTYRPLESSTQVRVVPFDVWRHSDGRLFADVGIPGISDASYSPFVALAVARFQPNSLPGLELSTVSKLRMVQLYPSRTVTIKYSGDRNFTVSLDGEKAGVVGSYPPASTSKIVKVILETCEVPKGTPLDSVEFSALNIPKDDIPAWMEDPEQTKTGNLGDIFQMRAPLGGGYARIRIREVEIVNVPSATPDPAFVSELNERVIFTDTTIPLPYGEAF